METIGGGIIKRHSLLVMLIVCIMVISTIGSSYAAADNQQSAGTTTDSALNNNAKGNQSPVETVETGTQGTVQSTSDVTIGDSATKIQQTQNTTENISNTTSNSQNSENTATNTQNAVQTAAINNQNSLNNTTIQPQAAAGTNYTNVHGIWLRAEDAGNITVNELKKANITDIFVKANLVSTPTYSSILSSIITKFQNSGIRIHAWITCFQNVNGNWINPANTTQQTTLLNAIKKIVTNYSVDGILLDYVRYSGVGSNTAGTSGTATITSFVQKVYNTVKSVKPKVAVSASVMPEGATNAYYYGQNYTQLAKYLDFIVPMVYKGNYGQNTTWIGSSIKYIVDHAGGKPVIAGLQTYISSYDKTPLSANELNADVKSALNNGASGYALYRYGLISKDFLTAPSFTTSDIQSAAANVKSYIESNHKLPNYVTIGSTQVTMPEFLKLMVKGLLQINSKITTPISRTTVDNPQNSTGSFNKGNINKTSYLDIAQRINSFIDSNGLAPNYATTGLGKVQYEQLIYMFSKILNYYNTNKVLPNYVSMDPSVKVSSSSDSGLPTTKVFTLDQIKSAATSLKSYIESNHELPNYVTIGSIQVKMTDFLRLLIIGTIEVNDGSKAQISLKTVNTSATPSENITSGNITKANYLDLANRLKAFIDANGALPNYATTSVGKIGYESLIYMYSKILAYDSTNNALPNYVSVSPWSVVSTVPIPSELQQYLKETKNCQVTNSQIQALAKSITSGKTSVYDKAVAIFNWVRDNIGYEFYYNTKYGAVGTLNAKKGNCVDTAHLLIALERAAGIPARYEHVKAQFTSGTWYGHVIAQVWVNGKWYNADGTSSSNTFGVINNWNTATATYYGTYAELPF
ncbi:pseudomurein-binding repeat-containing protein [Methanobacterium sp.]|uniref:pseudomurein-binding repeat-containing protein n=1 Tax=Methanobacterium sp. TaxID=2164 RepID=UPI003C728CEF